MIFISGVLFSQDVKSQGSSVENHYKSVDNLIEVMFIETSRVRIRNGQLTDLGSNATEGISARLSNFEWYRWSRFCDADESLIDQWAENGELKSGKQVFNLNNIYQLEIPGGHDVWEICRQLEEMPGIYQARP